MEFQESSKKNPIDEKQYEEIKKRLDVSRRAVALAYKNGDMSLWIYEMDTGRILQDFQEEGAFGYPTVLERGPEDIIAMGGVHPVDLPEYRRMYDEINAGAERSECTVRIYNRNSHKYQWLRCILLRQPIEEDKQNIVFGFCMNVELQKEMELRYEREVRLRKELIRESSAYYRINLSKRVVEEMYCRGMDLSDVKLPISVEELAGRGHETGIYPEDWEKIAPRLMPRYMLDDYKRGNTTETFLYRRRIEGKELHWMQGTLTKLKRTSSDDVIAFYTETDVDQEKKDDLTLQGIIKEEIEGIIRVNTLTKQCRIVLENHHMDHFQTGVNFVMGEEFMNFFLQDIVPEDLAKCRRILDIDYVREYLEGHKILQEMYRIRGKDGEIKRKKVRGFYLDDTKQEILYVRRDITDLYEEEQRQKTELLQAMEEVKRANRAKSDFLSRVSHDIRTPLNGIISLSGDEMLEGADEAQVREYMTKIHTAGRYLLGIINDVLDMSKIENQKVMLQLERTSIKELCGMLEDVIGEQCREKGLHLLIRSKGIKYEYLMLDKIRFNQIFVNLLSNAIKYTPTGGTVELFMEHLGTKDNCAIKKFIVRDTGVGMSKEFIPHAFESFAQEDSRRNEKNAQGTGLGLSIVKGLVEMMNGTIQLESELGKGTTYTIIMEIPIAEESVAGERIQPDYSILQGSHILVCEDHPLNMEITRKLLERKGCILDAAENGKIGVEMFKNSPEDYYDMILMDIRMPVMDGLDATRAIRKLKRKDAKKIPIVAMTANAFVQDVEASMEAGLNGHLIKPTEPEKLYETIRNSIAESR